MQIKRQAACRKGEEKPAPRVSAQRSVLQYGARCVELSWLDVFTSPLLSPHCGVCSTCTRTQGNLLAAVFFYHLLSRRLGSGNKKLLPRLV
jgi:hypothetical protein